MGLLHSTEQLLAFRLEEERAMVAPRRKILAVVTLFFVALLVAEYLLGDLPLNLLAALIVLAPAHGGAAVLIRETSAAGE